MSTMTGRSANITVTNLDEEGNIEVKISFDNQQDEAEEGNSSHEAASTMLMLFDEFLKFHSGHVSTELH